MFSFLIQYSEPLIPLTWIQAIARKEGFYVVLVEAIVPQHAIEDLQVIHMLSVCDLLLPATWEQSDEGMTDYIMRQRPWPCSSILTNHLLPESNTAWSHV